MAERSNANIFSALAIALAVGALVSWAGGDGGARAGSWSVFALCGALAFAINWLVFIPSALARTEHFYDLTGGITYITVTAVAVYLSDALDARATLVAAMVMVWALRLSTFLFLRISKSGKDSRFDDIKGRPADSSSCAGGDYRRCAGAAGPGWLRRHCRLDDRHPDRDRRGSAEIAVQGGSG